MAHTWWSHSVGLLPHKVTVYEHPEKAGVLYLRWRAGGNWKKRSLGVKLRDQRGRIRPEMRRLAESEAQRQYEILSGRRAEPTAPEERRALTIAGTWAVITDRLQGLYPEDTPHRREVRRELAHAARIWGAELPWAVIDRARLRMLGRTRVDELRSAGRTGFRGAEITVARMIAVARWLRDEGHIPMDAGHPTKEWKQELRDYWTLVARATEGPAVEAPHVERPRYTLEETRAILAVAHEVDPRFHLLLELGAGLRLGQVARARRSHLDLARGTFRVPSSGKKRGALLDLTAGQLAVVRAALGEGGYLHQLETQLPDYHLFPAGQMRGNRARTSAVFAEPERHGIAGPIDRTALRKWFRAAEELAEIPYVKGRGWVGIRRRSVDEGKKDRISREGLQALGGWTNTQVPDAIYAEQEADWARAEAAKIRARIRGELEAIAAAGAEAGARALELLQDLDAGALTVELAEELIAAIRRAMPPASTAAPTAASVGPEAADSPSAAAGHETRKGVGRAGAPRSEVPGSTGDATPAVRGVQPDESGRETYPTRTLNENARTGEGTRVGDN